MYLGQGLLRHVGGLESPRADLLTDAPGREGEVPTSSVAHAQVEAEAPVVACRRGLELRHGGAHRGGQLPRQEVPV